MRGADEAVRGAILKARPRARALAETWRAHPVRQALDAAFDACTSAKESAAVAERWLHDPAWLAPLLDPMVEALAAEPLIDIPLRATRDDVRIGAILYEHRAVSIAASVIDAAAWNIAPPRTTIVLGGRITLTRYVRANGAMLRHWVVGEDGASLTKAAARPIADGDVVRCDGRSEAMMIEAMRHDVVLLVATVRLDPAPVLREYGCADGALLRSATLDEGAARSAMLLTLLRHCGRRDAAACFDAAATDPLSPFRWDAMREWIALDAERALPRLATMSTDDPDPAIRRAAQASHDLVATRMAEARCRG